MINTPLFETINEIIKKESINSLKSQCEVIANFIRQETGINIAVIGEFKTGKSSFINSLLDMQILPSGVIPVTSVITKIKKGEKLSAAIAFHNRTIKEVPVEDTPAYINESNNPQNEKQVDSVLITLPDIKLPEGVLLVDTPGLGSFKKHNTSVTKHWIGQTGVALIAISSERPLSEQELITIKEISRITPETAILLTKTDLYTPDEINKIEDYITKSLLPVDIGNVRIFRYSTVKNTEKFKAQIYNELITPLKDNFTSTKDKIINHKIDFLARQCIAYLEIAKSASGHTEKEREQLKRDIFDRKTNGTFVAKGMALVLSDRLNGIREKVFAMLIKDKPSVTEKLILQFRNSYPDWSGNLYKRTRYFEYWLKEALKTELQQLAAGNTTGFEQIIKEAGDHFKFFTISFRKDLKDKIRNVLGIELPLDTPVMPHVNPVWQDIFVSRGFESHLDLLWFLFPMKIFGRLFGKYFEKQIEREVEINIYRLSSNITSKLSKEIIKIKTEAETYISNELNSLEKMLASPHGKSQHYDILLQKIIDKL